MTNITERFTDAYLPAKALVVYINQGEKEKSYIESFDFDKLGRMINAHPLSEQEAEKLGKIMLANMERQGRCFDAKGILPANLLFLRSGNDGCAVWYTPAQHRTLLFVEGLGLSDGRYPIPALIWKATRESLSVFAFKGTDKPKLNTELFEAPYFNIYSNGNVCMGTVDIDIDDHGGLEAFMKLWEEYFFNSRFSHLLADRSPLKSNIIQLYKSLFNAKKSFPSTELKKHSRSFKTLLNDQS
jgi:PRTRC genetic system protein B